MGFLKICRQKAWLLGTAVGIVFLGLGAVRGQLEIVWKKAVMICLECIGIG